jgi:Na+/melibiose symporter-like transporter
VPFTVALVPLIVYLSSVIVSSNLNKFYELVGRKKALFFGTFICIVALGSMYFITQEYNWIMYILAVFIGCSQTMVLSTGINFISDVVGTKAKTGAFVFGCYSLLDKFSAGAVIYLVGSSKAY